MALNSSMTWTLVGLVHLFPCTRSFFILVVVISLVVCSHTEDFVVCVTEFNSIIYIKK
jgi:hypothetical protein